MDDRLLRTTLTANAAISSVWGLAVAASAPWADAAIGVPTGVIALVGLATTGVAALFWRFSRRPVLRRSEGLIAAVGDTIFAATFIALAVALPELTPFGRWLVGLSGLVVADLAVAEFVGVRRLRSEVTAISRQPARA